MDSNKKINVLIVDDSVLMRRMIADILSSDERINVVGIAINGRMALNQLEKYKPDVITLDIEMPLMNGLETLKEIKRIRPTPTIMLSSLTKAGAEITLQSLELGAVDFLQKPQTEADFASIKNELIEKVVMASGVKQYAPGKDPAKKVIHEILRSRPSKTNKLKTLVIGSSTGGPQALKEVVPYLPADIQAQILIVQHMPPKFTDMFAQRLDKISQVKVKEAKDGDMLEKGVALLAPGNFHMTVENNRIKLNQEPHVCGVRPSVDITLASAAKIYKGEVICVILTGMGHDGSKGSGVVKKFGGYCIAEDKSTCIIYGMPKSVIDAGHADEIVPLHKIADAIVNVVYK